jgi:hypothetical protein
VLDCSAEQQELRTEVCEARVGLVESRKGEELERRRTKDKDAVEGLDDRVGEL